MNFCLIRRRGTRIRRRNAEARHEHRQRSRGLFATTSETGACQDHQLPVAREHSSRRTCLKAVQRGKYIGDPYAYSLVIIFISFLSTL